MTTIKLKRVYEPAESTDGFRVFVDKLWPRGIKKEALNCDEWNKEIEPSASLRGWFHQDKEKNWNQFKQAYQKELTNNPAVAKFVDEIQKQAVVTLVYGAKDPLHNHVVVLKAFLERKR